MHPFPEVQIYQGIPGMLDVGFNKNRHSGDGHYGRKSGGDINDSIQYAGDFELWARFYQHTDLYAVNALIGGFRKHGYQKTGFGMEQYLNEAQKCFLNDYKGHPYGKIESIIRKYVNFAIGNKLYILYHFPKIITTVLISVRFIYLQR